MFNFFVVAAPCPLFRNVRTVLVPLTPSAPPSRQRAPPQTAALPALPPSLVSLSVSGHVPDDTGLLETLAGLTQVGGCACVLAWSVAYRRHERRKRPQ